MKKNVSVIMVVAMLAAVLSGCGGSTEGKTPDVAVNEFLTAVKAVDFEKANDYVASEGDYQDDLGELTGYLGDDMVQALFNKYAFEKPSIVSEEEDTAQVKVKITSVDMNATIEVVTAKAMESVFAEDAEEITEDAMMQMFVDAMAGDDAVMAERELTLNLKKQNGQFKIVADENLIEAIMAGGAAFAEMGEL